MDKKQKLTYLETICQNMNLPADCVPGCPIITMSGRNRMRIENHTKLLEYTDQSILILARSYSVCIDGERIRINSCNRDEIEASGIFQNVRYIFEQGK